jgi:flagellar motor switch protein FliG
MEDVEKSKPEIAIQLRDSLITFDDIVFIDDRSIQKVIREVDTFDFTRALKGASDAVTGKFFNNVSARAGRALREDMEFMGPVMIADIKDARQRIIAIIRQLEESGELVISYPEEDISI